MGMYHVQLSEYADALRATGVTDMAFNGGPASVLCSFPGKTQNNLGYLFLIEFFVDSYIVSTKAIRAAAATTLTVTAGHRYLGRPGPGKPFHRPGKRSLCHRPFVRSHDLGVCRHHHQHQLGS